MNNLKYQNNSFICCNFLFLVSDLAEHVNDTGHASNFSIRDVTQVYDIPADEGNTVPEGKLYLKMKVPAVV